MATKVTPKKSLGQNFLQDHNIAEKIVEALPPTHQHTIIEIGPGKGILTEYLIQKHQKKNLLLIEIDQRCVEYLQNKYQTSLRKEQIIQADFLQHPWESYLTSSQKKVKIIGNLPYHLTAPIFFKILSHKNDVEQVVCMVQKEVAERIIAHPNQKSYGLLSVLWGTFYQSKLLFTVPPQVFSPVPKIHSAVLYCIRNQRKKLPCEEKFFLTMVKTCFQQRRKMLKNTLKPILSQTNDEKNIQKMLQLYGHQRPEQLSIENFIQIASFLQKK